MNSGQLSLLLKKGDGYLIVYDRERATVYVEFKPNKEIMDDLQMHGFIHEGYIRKKHILIKSNADEEDYNIAIRSFQS